MNKWNLKIKYIHNKYGQKPYKNPLYIKKVALIKSYFKI